MSEVSLLTRDAKVVELEDVASVLRLWQRTEFVALFLIPCQPISCFNNDILGIKDRRCLHLHVFVRPRDIRGTDFTGFPPVTVTRLIFSD